MSKQTGRPVCEFIGAADKLASFGGVGAQLGLVQLSPDALRTTARILEPSGAADPLAFNTNVDAGIRDLLGFGSPLAAPPTKRSRLRDGILMPETRHAFALPPWFMSSAMAAELNAQKLNEWVPEGKDLQAYLKEVRGLLESLSDKIAGKGKMNDEHKLLYRQIIFTAAWQESCWRQYIRKGNKVVPLASPRATSFDAGQPQYWRGVYDLNALSGDMNTTAMPGGRSYFLT